MRLAAASLAILLSAPGLAAAQDTLCEDPAGHCGRMVESDCLGRVGAGAIAATDPDAACAEQIENYRLCIEAAASCGAASGGASAAGEGCSPEVESEFWRIAESMGDCGGYSAFLKSCPGAGRAPFAEAKIAALGCAGGAGGGSERQKSVADGERFRDCPSCPEMITIPGGVFQMGRSGGYSTPVHRVSVPRFAIARTETTFDQWDACVADGGCGGLRPEDSGFGRGERPVINVSWEEAQRYVDWLNRKAEGAPYRLPSEAEWEYAARAGGGPAPDWRSAAEARGFENFGAEKCCANEGAVAGRDQWLNTAPVASFPANGFGLHDMLGNVSEYVQDCYNRTYRGAPSDGGPWMSGDCAKMIFRGGNWRAFFDHVNPTVRFFYERTRRNATYGFRVARSLPPR